MFTFTFTFIYVFLGFTGGLSKLPPRRASGFSAPMSFDVGGNLFFLRAEDVGILQFLERYFGTVYTQASA